MPARTPEITHKIMSAVKQKDTEPEFNPSKRQLIPFNFATLFNYSSAADFAG